MNDIAIYAMLFSTLLISTIVTVHGIMGFVP
jgi:hypothetical protein